MPLKVVIAKTGAAGPPTEMVLTEPTLKIGRTSANDLVIADERVSSNHAKIDKQGRQYTVTDLGSKNGSVLNGKKLLRNQPIPLGNGDTLVLGDHTLRFQIVDEVVEETVRRENPAIKAGEVADKLAAAFAEHLGDAAGARVQAVREALQASLANLTPQEKRTVLALVRARLGPQSTDGGGKDSDIQRREALFQAGHKAIATLSEHFTTEKEFDSAEQVMKFAEYVQLTLDIVLESVAKSLKGRKEFEEQFSADLTTIFAQQNNPIKGAGQAKDIARFLLDWRADRDYAARKAALDGAFKDLMMHQLGMLTGVQDALKTVLSKLDPKLIEARVRGQGLWSKTFPAAAAWKEYVKTHSELFEENTKMFNELIYPSIRKGYLATHKEEHEGDTSKNVAKQGKAEGS